MAWDPSIPQNASPYFGDGTSYGRELGRVSPEGNTYGTMRVVRDVVHRIWWSGEAWEMVEVAGQAASLTELNTKQRPFGEIWQVVIDGALVEYFRDVTAWKRLTWFWDIKDISEIPFPGFQVGEAHRVFEPDVPFMWNGFYWNRIKHTDLQDNEPDRHLPRGFLQFLAPDARVVFVSGTEITLTAAKGGTGKVWVSGEYIDAGRNASVFANLPSLEWDSQSNSLVAAYLEPATSYWIYLANTSEPAFVIDAMPGDASHGETPAWDFRGRLFLSRTPDTNDYLSTVGAGLKARLVGRITTDATAAPVGPLFLPELDISLISRTTSFPETYREFSDYQVQFVDQDSLMLALLDGCYGQIYVAGDLYYLGGNHAIARTDARVVWTGVYDAPLQLDSEAIAADTLYYIYLPAWVDAFNFNATNPDTNRPWGPTDDGAGTHYDAALDSRLRPFLSAKAPEEGRLSGQWPGYYTRHIGQVRTDANGRFADARDLSAIRQPSLNPSYFDGLAEINIVKLSDTELRMVRKRGTSGVVNVAGEAILTYEQTATECVHCIETDQVVQAYTEAEIADPLSDVDAASEHPNELLYVYLANGRSLWGAYAGGLFVTTSAPVMGYLSRSWPGNQARWIATVRPDSEGKFKSISCLVDSVCPVVSAIDDLSASADKVWSSSKVSAEIQKLWLGINAGQVYANQVSLGLPLRLRREGDSALRLSPLSGSVSLAFPDLSPGEVPEDGLALTLSGMDYQRLYYVGLNDSGLFLTTTEPVAESDQLYRIGSDALLAGWIACGRYPDVHATALTSAGLVDIEDSAHLTVTGSGVQKVPLIEADGSLNPNSQGIGWVDTDASMAQSDRGNPFDGSAVTSWPQATFAPEGSWISGDAGAAVIVNKCFVAAGHTEADWDGHVLITGKLPTQLSIQGRLSPNDAWTTIHTAQSLNPEASSVWITFTNSTAYRYYRWTADTGEARYSGLGLVAARVFYHTQPLLFTTQLDAVNFAGEHAMTDASLSYSVVNPFVAVSFNRGTSWVVRVGGTFFPIARDQGGVWQYWNGTAWVSASANTKWSALRSAFGVTGNQWAAAGLADVNEHWADSGGWTSGATGFDVACYLPTDQVAQCGVSAVSYSSIALNKTSGDWNVVSSWNREQRQWSVPFHQCPGYFVSSVPPYPGLGQNSTPPSDVSMGPLHGTPQAWAHAHSRFYLPGLVSVPEVTPVVSRSGRSYLRQNGYDVSTPDSRLTTTTWDWLAITETAAELAGPNAHALDGVEVEHTLWVNIYDADWTGITGSLIVTRDS